MLERLLPQATPMTSPSHAIIKELARERGFEQRIFTDEEILRRLLFSSVNEACKILQEGKALRASDIDVMWLNGFGFPRYRGGLMFWADQIGAREVYNQIGSCISATAPAGGLRGSCKSWPRLAACCAR